MIFWFEYVIYVLDEFCFNKYLRVFYLFWRVGVIDVDFVCCIYRYLFCVKSVICYVIYECEICVYVWLKGFYLRYCDFVSTYFYIDLLDFGILFCFVCDLVIVIVIYFDVYIWIVGDVWWFFCFVFVNYLYIWCLINFFYGFIGDLFFFREWYVFYVCFDFFNFFRCVLCL